MFISYSIERKMVDIKDVVFDLIVIGMSSALLWHFANIWRYGKFLVQEPNLIILSLETAGLFLIFALGLTKLIGDLRGKGR